MIEDSWRGGELDESNMKANKFGKQVESKVGENTIDYVYPMDLQCYNTKLIGLDDHFRCVDDVLDRIKVLTMVHEVFRNRELLPEEQTGALMSTLNSAGLTTFSKLLENDGYMTMSMDDMVLRRSDHASFQFLILALCDQKNDVLLRWWFEGELKLFMLRASSLNEIGVVNFITLNNLPFSKLEGGTLELMKRKLMMHGEDWQKLTYYKLQMKTVKNLILSYKVYHHLDDACVPAELISPILSDYYSEILSEHLKDAKYYMRESASMYGGHLIEILSKVKASLNSIKYISSDSDPGRPLVDSNNIQLSNIDQVAAESFPPCMLRIHLALRKNHHLKNSSRLQYVIFLKDLGMQYEDVLKLFRDEFTKKILPERFDKEYAYYVKHMFGMVGSRRNYHSKNCMELAKSVVPIDDCNGCPFYQGDIEDIISIMNTDKFTETKADEIIRFGEKSQSNAACAKFFGMTHHCRTPASIQNPVEYALKSFKKKNKVHQDHLEVDSLEKLKNVLRKEEPGARISKKAQMKSSMLQTLTDSRMSLPYSDVTVYVPNSVDEKNENHEMFPERPETEIELEGPETETDHRGISVRDSSKKKYRTTRRSLNKNSASTEHKETIRILVLAQQFMEKRNPTVNVPLRFLVAESFTRNELTSQSKYPAIYIEGFRKGRDDHDESIQLKSNDNFAIAKFMNKNESSIENLKKLAVQFRKRNYGSPRSWAPTVQSFSCHDLLNKKW